MGHSVMYLCVALFFSVAFCQFDGDKEYSSCSARRSIVQQIINDDEDVGYSFAATESVECEVKDSDEIDTETIITTQSFTITSGDDYQLEAKSETDSSNNDDFKTFLVGWYQRDRVDGELTLITAPFDFDKDTACNVDVALLTCEYTTENSQTGNNNRNPNLESVVGLTSADLNDRQFLRVTMTFHWNTAADMYLSFRFSGCNDNLRGETVSCDSGRVVFDQDFYHYQADDEASNLGEAQFEFNEDNNQVEVWLDGSVNVRYVEFSFNMFSDVEIDAPVDLGGGDDDDDDGDNDDRDSDDDDRDSDDDDDDDDDDGDGASSLRFSAFVGAAVIVFSYRFALF